MEKQEYVLDPTRASLFSYHKTENADEGDIKPVPDSAFTGELREKYKDTEYYKLLRRFDGVTDPTFPEGFRLMTPYKKSFTEHIRRCYDDGAEPTSLELWRYMEYLVIALRDESGRIAASAAADVDFGVREGSIEWVQVSPEYRRRGLGTYVVNELVYRLRNFADFVTVSCKTPEALGLFMKCGFGDMAIWHYLSEK